MKTRKLVLMALFIALSFIGANIKIAGSIAFDSMAGFLGTLILGPLYGAAIGAMGHLLTAATSGFYLGLPTHMIIMVDMALTMLIFGFIYKKLSSINEYLSMTAAGIAAIIVNGPLCIFAIIPITGSGILAMLPILCLAALLNVVIAIAVFKLLPSKLINMKDI